MTPREQANSVLTAGCIRVDLSTAVPANVINQTGFGVRREWYFDAWFACTRCNEEFCWTVRQQRNWFERLRLYSYAVPKLCSRCRHLRQNWLRLRQQYDELIGPAVRSREIGLKRQVIAIIEEREVLGDDVADGHREAVTLLRRQIANLQSAGQF